MDRGLPPPPPSKWRNIAIALLIVGIVVGCVIGYGATVGQIDYLQTQIENLQTQVSGLQADKTALQISYSSLQGQYQQLQKKYQYSATIPYTLIWNGTVKWFFKDLEGDILSWQMPIDTYRTYASYTKSSEVVGLKFDNGTITNVRDIRPYIQPQFFSKVIQDLTKGHTDEEFVREVDNMKNQIIVYGSGLGDFYRWPAETLTECRGQCGDTTILMASMIVEGNSLNNYGMKVYIYYVDSNHISGSPMQVNHAIIEVDFKDGDKWILETTTNYFLNYLSYESVYGWKYDVTNQGLGG